MMVTVVGLATHATPVSAQAVSSLWGIDSCSTAPSVVPGTQSAMGTPQFMARYLGNANPCAMGPSEVSYLSSDGIYIMLIYSPNQNFTNGTGTTEAQSAIGLAQSLGAPPGTAIFRDVEAGSPITTSYIVEWYQAFKSSASGYVPGFYENPYSGSGAFPSQYCAAVGEYPSIADAPLWSSEPELLRVHALPVAGSGVEPVGTGLSEHHGGLAVHRRGLPHWPGGLPNVDVDEFNAAYEKSPLERPEGTRRLHRGAAVPDLRHAECRGHRVHHRVLGASHRPGSAPSTRRSPG